MNVSVAVKMKFDPEKCWKRFLLGQALNGRQRLEVDMTLNPARMVASLPA